LDGIFTNNPEQVISFRIFKYVCAADAGRLFFHISVLSGSGVSGSSGRYHDQTERWNTAAA